MVGAVGLLEANVAGDGAAAQRTRRAPGACGPGGRLPHLAEQVCHLQLSLNVMFLWFIKIETTDRFAE